ncbi:MAG TPA: hypothetical protein VI172_01825 [Candidatus Dormibacteraeota bacterium]|jgi:hypothetical protein
MPAPIAVEPPLPAGVTQLAEPCWVNPEEDAHYASEQDALEATCDHLRSCDRHPRPRVESSPCWTGQAACGRWLDVEDFPIGHYGTVDDVLHDALAADWSVVDGVLRCEDGDACEAKP